MPLPKPFENEREFLQDFESHSKTPRASFSIEQINCLYELAGEEPRFNFSSNHISMALRYDKPETRELLYKANKNISKKERRARGDNLFYLSDYRKGYNSVACLDDYR